MKLFLLFFISLITSTAFTAQTPVLASVEITSSIAPPVEKNRVKKKRHQKKRFRKPNHSSQTKSKAARTRFIVVTCVLAVLALLVFLIFFVFGLATTLEAIILSALAVLALTIATFALLITTIIYNIANRNKEKKAAIPLKRSTEELKAEVAYLKPEKVARYFALNEQLTTAKVAQRNATAVLKNRLSTKEERNKAKIDLSNLKQDIKIINQELKKFRQQNSIKQARAERN